MKLGSLLTLPELKQSLIFTNDRLTPFIICCLGGLTQVVDLLAIYFSYPTITAISLYSPLYISLPAVSLCYRYDMDSTSVSDQIPSHLAPSHPDPEASFNPNELRYRLTFDRLNSITADVNQLIVSCIVANPSSSRDYIDYVDCSQVSTIQINLNAHQKCFTFFQSDFSPFIYPKILFSDEYFLSLQVNLSITSNPYLKLIIHDNDQEVPIAPGSPEIVTMDGQRFNDFVFTYYTEQVTILGPPYSNCLPYVTLFNRTKSDLIKECIFNSIYLDYKAIDDEIMVHLPFPVPNVTFVRGIRSSRYRAMCETKYNQPECRTQSFELVLLRSLNNSEISEDGIISIMFGYPIGTQINVTMVEKQNFVEYFCYVASIINLWLEISVLGVVQFVFAHGRKFFVKKKNQLQLQQQQNGNELRSHLTRQRKLRDQFYLRPV